MFSIVIPTCNRPDMLRRALDSVARQTFKCFEVIVIEDGSRSSSKHVVDEFSHLKIKYIHCEMNRGAATARNIGIENSSAQFISFLDDDDEFQKDFLTNTYQVLSKRLHNVYFSWSNVRNVRYKSGSIASYDETGFTLPNKYSTSMALEDTLSIGIGHGVTVPKDLLVDVGGFNQNLYTVEDTELLIKLLKKGAKATLVPGINVNIHHHVGERMTSNQHDRKRIEECLTLICEQRSFLADHPILMKQLESHLDYLFTRIQPVHGNV